MAATKELLNAVHGAAVFERRVEVLSRELSLIFPPGRASVLDIGAGNGAIARALMEKRPELSISGVDVLARPQSFIEVAIFDGAHLPFADGSLDYAMLIDVLHHTDDPAALLKEAARVARLGVVVKDHLVEGLLARPTLRFMDWVGNFGHDVRLPYNYLTPARWAAVQASAGLHTQAEVRALGLYPAPFTWIFDRGLHVLALLGR